MKKKLTALALALVMACSLAVPAAAAQTAEERLSAVTASVKKTLALDTAQYTSFYGDLEEDLLAPTWRLEWSGEKGSLSVSASEEGKVLSYRLYEDGDTRDGGNFAPAFPAGSQDSARAAAQAFLDKVLTKGETVTLKPRTVRLGTEQYRFSGEILLNGLSAGLSCSVSIRCSDNAVVSFCRDDLNGTVMGGVPSAKAAVSQARARTTLKSTLALRLEYVLPEGSSRAVLRYLPESGDQYYVDAATGKLVNLSELIRSVDRDGGSSAGGSREEAAADNAAPAETLTQAEQTGAEKLKGVLDKAALDQKVRAVSALGLDRYTLSTANYTAAREDQNGQPAVTATLRYGRQVNGTSWRRTVEVDARTGELLRVYSSGWMPEEAVERPVDLEAAREKAAAFLNRQCPGAFEKTALYSSGDALESDGGVFHSLTYSQQANGIFFPGNSIFVGVDATDGSISAYEKRFDETVTFDSLDGILTADQALEAWLDTYTAELQYVRVPTAVDYSRPEYQLLRDCGIAYLYRLVLGYALEREDYLVGIDARTGQPVKPDWSAEETALTYSDLSGHWAREKIEALAAYGVGYTGGSFRPNAALTQLDLIALLASTDGYRYDPAEEGAADALYRYAFDRGLLGKDQRSDSAVLTRMETVRLVLDAMGYGPVAQLEGIYRTRFADDAGIPRASYGYAALAQGLGMVSGDTANRFRPGDAATRAQAAVMLYNLMAR